MKKKTEVLYSLPCPVFMEGCDLIIRSGELLQSSKTGDSFCLLDLISLQDCSFHSVTLTLKFYDAQGLQNGEAMSYTFSDLSLHRGESFSGKNEIPVPNGAARSFTVYINKVVSEEDHEPQLFNEGDVRLLNGRRTLEEALGDPELAEQFRVRYGADCRYLRSEQAGLWFCVCGSINKSADRSCAVCHRARKALTDVNLDSLRAEAGIRVKSEAAAEEESVLNNQKKKLFSRRNLVFLIPIALLLVLLIAAAPGALSREHRYRQAIAALDAGDYDTAEAILELLPSYRDSGILVSGRIPYLRAKALKDAAEAKDLSALSDAGYTEEDLDSDTTVTVLLYTAAAEAFETSEIMRTAPNRQSSAELPLKKN